MIWGWGRGRKQTCLVNIYIHKYINIKIRKKHPNYYSPCLCNGHMDVAGIYHCLLPLPTLFPLSKHFSWSWFCAWWGDSNFHSEVSWSLAVLFELRSFVFHWLESYEIGTVRGSLALLCNNSHFPMVIRINHLSQYTNPLLCFLTHWHKEHQVFKWWSQLPFHWNHCCVPFEIKTPKLAEHNCRDGNKNASCESLGLIVRSPCHQFSNHISSKSLAIQPNHYRSYLLSFLLPVIAGGTHWIADPGHLTLAIFKGFYYTAEKFLAKK